MQVSNVKNIISTENIFRSSSSWVYTFLYKNIWKLKCCSRWTYTSVRKSSTCILY